MKHRDFLSDFSRPLAIQTCIYVHERKLCVSAYDDTSVKKKKKKKAKTLRRFKKSKKKKKKREKEKK